MKNNLLLRLIALRTRALLSSIRKSLPGKKSSGIMPVVFGLLMLYVVGVCEFLFVQLWSSMTIFCHAGLTWLYFAMCGLFAAAINIIANVFVTQNQLYNATDNELLLSLPIPPGTILLSRMSVLLVSSFATTVLMLAPAVGVYMALVAPLTAAQVLGIAAALFAVTFGSQALSCVLGYLLHLVLGKMKNKAFGSMLFMLFFLAAYFAAYSQINKFMTFLAANGEEAAAFVRIWAAPFYAMGLACGGSLLHSLLLLLGTSALFTLVYWVLSVTFIRSARKTSSGSSSASTKKENRPQKQRSPSDAVFHKELRRLLTCPIYLTNTGIGAVFILGIAIAAPFFKAKLLSILTLLPGDSLPLPLLVPAMIAMFNGMGCFTAPSVSLEGRNLWVSRSLPLSGRDILLGKLKLHLAITGTASVAAGLSCSLSLGCSPAECVLNTVLSAEIALLFGILGLLFNLRFPTFQWLNASMPCKQGMPVLFVMLAGMGLGVILPGVRYLTGAIIPTPLYLTIAATLIFLAAALLYRTLMSWGIRRFNSFAS